MARNTGTQTLIAKAASGALARDRFSRSLSLVPAFGLGVVYVRTIAYTGLAVVQFGGLNLGPFLTASFGTVLAATLVLIMFSWTQMHARSAAPLFFQSTPRGGLLLRRWRLRSVLRPVPVIASGAYGACVVGIAVAAPRTGLPVVALGVLGYVSVAGVVLWCFAALTRRRFVTSSLAEITSLALALLALIGPDLWVEGDQVHAVFFFHRFEASEFPAYLALPLVGPAMLPAFSLVRTIEGALRRVVVRAVQSGLRSFNARRPDRRRPRVPLLLAVYLRQARLAHWIIFGAVVAVLPSLVAMGAAVLLPASVATVVWVGRANGYLVGIAERWTSDTPPRRLVRQVATSAALVFLLHAAAAAIVVFVVTFLGGPGSGG